MTEAQLISAAYRELRADPPDVTQARGYVSDIPLADVPAVADVLLQIVGMLEYRAASTRVKAGSRR